MCFRGDIRPHTTVLSMMAHHLYGGFSFVVMSRRYNEPPLQALGFLFLELAATAHRAVNVLGQCWRQGCGGSTEHMAGPPVDGVGKVHLASVCALDHVLELSLWR